MEYDIRFMTYEEHNTIDSFMLNENNQIYLNIATKFDESWVSKYGCNNNKWSTESYAGIISSSPNLVLDNIKYSDRPIEFIINSDFNMDTIVSIFLSVFIARNRVLPIYINKLLDFVNKAKSDDYSFNHYNYINLYTVMSAIPYLKDNRVECDHERRIIDIKRGISLIDIFCQRLIALENIIKSDFFDSTLIKYGLGFDKEIDFIKNDVSVFREEIKDEGVAHEKRIRVYSESEKKFVLANVLLYKKKSQSKLVSIWSNIKYFNENNTEYDLTLLIKDRFAGQRTDARIELENRYSVSLNRYEIRVRNKTDFKLYNLGKELELEEVQKERQLFKNQSEFQIWRENHTKNKRFKDSYWSTNRFSWYDGRNNDYMYIDSPTTDSVLSVDEVIGVLEGLANQKMEGFDLRFIIPFSYGINKNNHRKIVRYLKSEFRERNIFPSVDDLSNYYIDEFFGESDDYDTVHYYSGSNLGSLFEDVDVGECGEIIQKGEFQVTVFNNNIGFLILWFKSFNERECSVEDIYEVIKKVSKSGGQLVNSLMSGLAGRVKIRADKVIHYFQAHIRSEIISENLSQQNAIALTNEEKICSDICSSFEHHEFEERTIARYITKKGISNITYYNRYCDDEFLLPQDYFHILLFSYYHRVSLVNYSLLLAQFDRLKKSKRIKKLRQDYLSFVTQNWFSQISTNPQLLNFYKLINITLEISALNMEVSEQLSAIDDYYQNVFKNRIENISIYGFPVVLMSTLATIGFFNTKGMVIDVQITVLSILCIYIIMFLVFYSIQNRETRKL